MSMLAGTIARAGGESKLAHSIELASKEAASKQHVTCLARTFLEGS